MAQVIQNRLAVLRHAPNLSSVPVDKPERRHLLKGKRTNQYAVDLVHPYRLIFEPGHTPPPRRDDGGLDTDRITVVRISEVADYH